MTLARLISHLSLLRELSKSGIVALVLISVLSGYLAGHPFERPLELKRLGVTLLGILLLASGASALNQVQERHLDAAMPRTAKRPLPSGRIAPRTALLFSLSGITAGLGILAHIDFFVCLLGLLAVIFYNGLYTLWWKPRWAFAAIPGAIPGALPAVMGYIAAHRHWSAAGGWFLFSIVFFWQMPHFWTLAIRFQKDYRQGGIPTLPVWAGSIPTVRQIGLWSIGYIALSLLAPFFLGVGLVYLVCASLMGVQLLKELWNFAHHPEISELDNDTAQSKAWLRFFLWINLSLIVYLWAIVLDLWSVYLIPHFFSR